MVRGKQVLRWSFMLCAATAFIGAGKASARPLLAGSIWPNGNLENASSSPLELNSPSMNNAPGGAGTWRRGGGDFTGGANPGPYNFDLWDNSHGTVSGTHALVVVDNSPTSNGEWFVPDFDVDATVVPVTPGGTYDFHFSWNFNTVGDMRVTIRGDDGIGSFGLGNAFDFLANGSTGGAFVVADFVRTLPANCTGIRMNIASGGGSEVTGFLAVDDISVVAVPEPTCAFALVAAAGLLVRRRRA